MNKTYQQVWLALMIGNSRLHWAWFEGNTLKKTWNTNHLATTLIEKDFPKEILQPTSSTQLPLYIASVVPQQTAIWQNYTTARVITLDQVPLQGVYPTLGIDRALAVWGAICRLGSPILVIDGGTALTFTGVNSSRTLIGGAILPGVRSQLHSLNINTAALPKVKVELSQQLPQRWALDTKEAIKSGIVYTILAGIQSFLSDWWDQFPDSKVVITGGDGNLLLSYLQMQYPEIAARIVVDAHLIFWGMRSLKMKAKT